MRAQEAEKIIQARAKRLEFQGGIIRQANNSVIAAARRSEAEKRKLQNIMNESQRSNLWNRFDNDLGRMMQYNSQAMKAIEQQSYEAREDPPFIQPGQGYNYSNQLYY